MTALAAPLPRCCEHCDAPLVRKQYTSKRESAAQLARRRFCDRACAAGKLGTTNLGNPNAQAKAEVVPFPLPPSAFTRAYQRALGQGTDLLELNDATWERDE